MSDTEEEFIPEDELEEGPAALKRLREKLKKAVGEKQEYLEGWQRSRADFANFKKEEASMHADRLDRLRAELLGSLLPALDALELAVKHHPEEKTLGMLEKQFLDSLKSFGVERFGEKGEEFSPHKHEALRQNEKGEEVESVQRSGYAVGEKIIRPAHVILN